MSGQDADKVVQRKTIAQVRVRIHSQEIEDGYCLHDWDDRMEADIETLEHDKEYLQVEAESVEDVLDVLGEVDLREVMADG